jgi:hypothetical protein
MSNYQLGKIYKITSDQTDKIYVGSTTRVRLSERMSEHRRDSIKENRAGKNVSSKEIMKYGDAKIILIETYPCNSKDELNAREQYYIELYKTVCVNKQKAYVLDKKLNKIQNHVKYYNEHKEEIKQKVKTYYENNTEKINDTKRKYNIENKEKMAKLKKDYYLKNLQTVKEHQLTKETCICGVTYSLTNKSAHRKSKFHQEYVNKNIII